MKRTVAQALEDERARTLLMYPGSPMPTSVQVEAFNIQPGDSIKDYNKPWRKVKSVELSLEIEPGIVSGFGGSYLYFTYEDDTCDFYGRVPTSYVEASTF